MQTPNMNGRAHFNHPVLVLTAVGSLVDVSAPLHLRGKSSPPDMEGESAPREGESAEALAARRKADKERKAAEKAEQELQKEANRKAREAAQKVKEAGGAAEADVIAPRVTLRNYETHDFANMFIQSDCPAAARTWTSIGDLTATLAGQKVWVRGRMATSRKQGKMLCFLQLRESIHTVQAVVFSKESDIVPFAAQLPRESVVDVYGEISLPNEPIASCTQSAVELQVRTQRTKQPYSTALQHNLAGQHHSTALKHSRLTEQPYSAALMHSPSQGSSSDHPLRRSRSSSASAARRPSCHFSSRMRRARRQRLRPILSFRGSTRMFASTIA